MDREAGMARVHINEYCRLLIISCIVLIVIIITICPRSACYEMTIRRVHCTVSSCLVQSFVILPLVCLSRCAYQPKWPKWKRFSSDEKRSKKIQTWKHTCTHKHYNTQPPYQKRNHAYASERERDEAIEQNNNEKKKSSKLPASECTHCKRTSIRLRMHALSGEVNDVKRHQ